MTRLSALLTLLIASNCGAETGASFLKIPVGARSIGMGRAFTAVADDANAIWWNPAGLGGLLSREVSATHSRLFADLNYDFASLAVPASFGTWGVQVGHLGKGELEGRDEQGRPTGSFTSRDILAGVAFGRAVSADLQVGAGVKVLRSEIADVSAWTGAVDLGALYRLGVTGLQVGVAVQNLGPGLKFLSQRDALPLTLSTGTSWRPFQGLIVSAEAAYRPNEERTSFGAGAEYELISRLAVRGGYLGRLGEGVQGGEGLEGLTGFGAGLGFKVGRLGLDYAITPFGELGNAHRLSVGAKF